MISGPGEQRIGVVATRKQRQAEGHEDGEPHF
jgi:hypothetical protein